MSKALYNGVELPVLPEIANSYEYAWLLLATPDGTPQLLLANGSGEFSYSSADKGTGIYLWFTTAMLCMPVGETWVKSSEATSDGNQTLTISAPPAETFWANFDIYDSDGSLYLAASLPVPIKEGFDLKSWLTGFALGFSGKPLPLNTGKKIVAYSYNGTVLPKLPEWDREMYPYAVIVKYQYAPNWRFLFFSALPLEQNGNNFTVPADYIRYEIQDITTGTEWVYVGTGETYGGTGWAMWANTDILKADGTLYLSASEPIPVYE